MGTKTLITDVYGMKSDEQFVDNVEDNIRHMGSMDKLMPDSAQSEIITRVKEILRALFIDDWKSEAYHQNQNFAERRNQTIKRHTNTLLDKTGAPAFAWLLKICYVCFVLNHSCNATIKNTPLNASTGSTCDMPPFLRFHFLEPVFFNTEEASFSSNRPE